jgi:oxygen-independent coproporphyrinogen-3 oxidase
MTAISRLGGAYSQNARDFDEYAAAIDAGRLATVRGRWLSHEDELRGTTIERLMCGRELRFNALEARYDIEFRRHFADELRKLRPAVRDRLIEVLPDRLHVTARGRPLVRVLASAFDAYLEPTNNNNNQ